MRIISNMRDEFFGTHKGHNVLIERENDGRFYIRVWSIASGSHAYDGYAPKTITTMAEAKREALKGAKL